MKPIYAYLALLLYLGLSSCQERIDVDMTQVGSNVPTLNYIAYAKPSGGEETHSLYLSSTSVYNPKTLDVRSLSLRINGVEHAPLQAEEGETDGGRSSVWVYRIPATYKEGDHVRLSLSLRDERTIVVEQVVPKRPLLLRAELGKLEQYQESDGYRRNVYPLHLRLQDYKGEANHYRLVCKYTKVYSDEGKTIEKRSKPSDLHVEYIKDFVLMDGSPLVSEELGDIGDLWGTKRSNKYMVFDDRLFSDQEVDIRVDVPSDVVDDPHEQGKRYKVDSGGQVQIFSFERTEISVWLETITREAYYYYKALGMINSDDYSDENPFVTPVSIPSNVKGGTGIFGIFTQSEPKIFTVRSRGE